MTVLEVDPDAILYSVAEHGVVARIGASDLLPMDPRLALAVMRCFSPPCTAPEAEGLFGSKWLFPFHGKAAPGEISAAFRKTVAALRQAQILREAGAAANAPKQSQAASYLTALTIVAEDLVSDISAMGEFADTIVEKNLGEPLDQVLRHALGELTRISVSLAAGRKDFMARQLESLERSDRLHLGAGGHNLPGWINVDSTKADLRLDLRWGLPFAANTFQFVFLSHLFEHLYKKRDAPKLLQEIVRVLKPGGVARIIVPNARVYMTAYVENDEDFFTMQRRTWFTWAPRARSKLEAILGYLGAPETPGGRAQHKYGYDFETLKIMLQDAGFSDVQESRFMGSAHEPLRVDNSSYVADANANGKYASLFVEAIK